MYRHWQLSWVSWYLSLILPNALPVSPAGLAPGCEIQDGHAAAPKTDAEASSREVAQETET